MSKTYVQFFDRHNGQRTESLGSDGYCPLDGRLSVDNLKREIFKILYQKRNVKRFASFEIRKGNFKYFKVIYTPTVDISYASLNY